jgi:hypothetical protein
MELTVRGNLDTRVALLEQSIEERKQDIADANEKIDKLVGKIDKLTYSALFLAITLLADIVLEKTGLLNTILHHGGG